MKRFVMVVTLACALSGTVLAGDIPSTDVKSPTPPYNTETTLPGEIPTTDYSEEISAAALSGLLMVLGLLVV